MAGQWLLKTEPDEYSFEDLDRDGRAVWDGVTNPLALKHLRAIQKGDELLIYHTGKVRAVVGLAVSATDPYPDPRKANPRLVVVNVLPVRRFSKPVALDAIKARPEFRDFDLVRLPRLSVMPVPAPAWKAIMTMAGYTE
jgi:predicted RNA-binding protein with PUA-like domain